MRPLIELRSRVVLLVHDDVDTDQIIPARFLKGTDKLGLGDQLFADWRAKAAARGETFALDAVEARGAEVLVAGKNFGCGSSREHAAWALAGRGFRAVVARSFADIFRNNAAKNGILTVALDEDAHARLVAAARADARTEIALDVAAQTLTLPDGARAAFPLDPFARQCLLRGVDELGFLLQHEREIASHEAARFPS